MVQKEPWYRSGAGRLHPKALVARSRPNRFCPFPADTDYFGKREQSWMINFRVRDLEAMAAQPERWYTSPPLTAQVSGIQKECEFYRAGVVDGVFLPEDFSFCLSARALGFESQLLEANTGHIGSFTYEHRAVTPQCDAVK